MKLSEIRAALAKYNAMVKAGPMLGEEFTDYSQRIWDSKPRIPYEELPASLQKAVREKYPLDVFGNFLVECYTTPEFEAVVRNMSPEDAQKLPEPPDTYVSFYTLTQGIDKSILEGLLIRARNSAIYTLEDSGNARIDTDNEIIIFPQNTDSAGIVPDLYGNHACAAFEAVLQQYRAAEKEKEARKNDTAAIIPTIAPLKEIVAPIDMVTRKLFKNELPFDMAGRIKSGNEITVKDENGKNKKIPLAPIVSVNLLDLPPTVQISREFSKIDDIVHSRICSLYEAGYTQFTGQAIYAAMTGSQTAEATADWLALIDECWTRLNAAQITLDTGSMGDGYKFARWKRQQAVIMGKKDTYTVGNQYGQTTAVVYTITDKPILLEYAECLNQINRYPRILQNTPVNKTPEIMVLQNFLLDRITAMPKISNHIKYESIWDVLKIQVPENITDPKLQKKKDAALRKKKTMLRGHIHKMLQYWMNNGFISGWKEEAKGKTVYGIIIAKPQQAKALPNPPKSGNIPPEKW